MAGFALVFPGQGAQAVGMGRDLFEGDSAARAVFEEADSVLGFGLSDLCFTGSAEQLQLTANAQPAILAVSIAALAALRRALGPQLSPLVAAGHSLGEYSALVASGALTFADALLLVRERGRLMQAASEVTPGAMVAVLGLSEEQVHGVCREASPTGVVVVANYNAPGQSVLSGEVEAVAAAARLAREAGARRTVALAVGGPFHSPLMAPAARDFAAALERARVSDPGFPVIANVTAAPLTQAAEIRGELRSQLSTPVRWSDSVRRMHEMGATSFVEVGPGTVLSGLVKRIVGGVRTLAVGSVAGLAQVREVVEVSSTGGGS